MLGRPWARAARYGKDEGPDYVECRVKDQETGQGFTFRAFMFFGWEVKRILESEKKKKAEHLASVEDPLDDDDNFKLSNWLGDQ
jgi:hypothetical protein